MVDALQVYLPLVIYVLLIIILIIGIILGIKSIKTLSKVEKVVDDVNDKVQALNGFFNIIDFTTDKLVSLTDHLVDGVTNIFGKFFKKKVRKGEDE